VCSSVIMGQFDQSFSSSPVLVFPPQLPPQHFNMSSQHIGSNTAFGHPSHSFWTQTLSQPQTPSGAGRKRSRDEAASNLEDDVHFPPEPAPAESEEGWEYGEGMTLIKPNGILIDASSQTGTWLEEKLPAPVAQTPPAVQDRPILRSYKSQRLDLSSTPAISEEVGFVNGLAVAPSPPKASTIPTIDDFTIHLGIGWSRISSDEHIQAAARGWAKFIENHYPVTDVQIVLQSKGLASYLVEAREGYFLFGDELKEGRLVSKSLEKTFQYLQSVPPMFDGEDSMIVAAQTPKHEAEPTQELAMSETMGQPASIHGLSASGAATGGILMGLLNGTSNGSHSTGQPMEVEMDMS
jgi:hypothetical protein